MSRLVLIGEDLLVDPDEVVSVDRDGHASGVHWLTTGYSGSAVRCGWGELVATVTAPPSRVDEVLARLRRALDEASRHRSVDDLADDVRGAMTPRPTPPRPDPSDVEAVLAQLRETLRDRAERQTVRELRGALRRAFDALLETLR